MDAPGTNALLEAGGTMGKTLRVEDRDGIRTVTLDRPERRNALTGEMIRELTEALREAGASGAGVLVLAGAGEAFCSGLDLAELEAMAGRSAAEHRAESEAIAAMFRALHDLEIPTIGAVNGAAVAGGMGLATICDFTIAVPEAKFGYTEVRIGFLPAIVSVFLVAQVGEKRARDLLLTGRLIDAAEARELGLVWRVVERAELPGAVESLARTLLRNSPESLRATKRLLRGQSAGWRDAALAEAVEANAALRQTADFREGLAAFLEKRRPGWPSQATGRWPR
jgi:methylglutaconyl-CoA hydratase